MAVDVTPSGKAPPGRLRFGVGAMALVTAFPVAARGSHADNSAGPAAAGPHSAHAGGRQLHHSRRAPASGSSRPERCRGARAGREDPLKHLADGCRTDTTPHKHLKRD